MRIITCLKLRQLNPIKVIILVLQMTDLQQRHVNVILSHHKLELGNLPIKQSLTYDSLGIMFNPTYTCKLWKCRKKLETFLTTSNYFFLIRTWQWHNLFLNQQVYSKYQTNLFLHSVIDTQPPKKKKWGFRKKIIKW